MPASRRAPAGVPPPLLPSASWLTSPKHVWTVPPHWHWSLPPDPARKSCHRVVVPERAIRDQPSSPSFAANTSAHTALPRHAEGFDPSPSSPHPPEPQALLFPLSPAGAASSPQLLVKAPPSQEVLCCGCCAHLVLQLLSGDSWVALQVSFRQTQEQRRKQFAKPQTEEEGVPVGNLDPGLS